MVRSGRHGPALVALKPRVTLKRQNGAARGGLRLDVRMWVWSSGSAMLVQTLPHGHKGTPGRRVVIWYRPKLHLTLLQA